MATKQKSGLYRSKVKIGVDVDGKDVFKWISGKSKRELEDARREVEAYYIDGTGLREDRLFGPYATEWFKVRKEPFISDSTRASYRTMLNKHVLPAFGERNLRAIQAVELQSFLNGFTNKSKSQITLAMAVLNGILADAKADRILAHNPAENLRRPTATPPEEKRALTDKERERMRELFSTHDHGLYLAVMYYTGVRPGEALGLKWGDFDWNDGLLHIQRDIDFTSKTKRVGDLKTRAADRYIPIPHELKTLLLPHRGFPDLFLFTGSSSGKPLSQATAERMWIELMLACKLAVAIPPEESKYKQKDDIRGKYKPLITPHTMRHNYITMCWENGLDILLTMKIVGHSDYKTTMNIYTHLSQKHLDKAKVKIDEMFSGKKVAQKLHNPAEQ